MRHTALAIIIAVGAELFAIPGLSVAVFGKSELLWAKASASVKADAPRGVKPTGEPGGARRPS